MSSSLRFVALDKRVEQIVTVWFNAMWLTNPRVPKSQRDEMARQVAKIIHRPIHPGRWKFVENELQQRAAENGRSIISD